MVCRLGGGGGGPEGLMGKCNFAGGGGPQVLTGKCNFADEVNHCLMANTVHISAVPKIWYCALSCSESSVWRMKLSFSDILDSKRLQTVFSPVSGFSIVFCPGTASWRCVRKCTVRLAVAWLRVKCSTQHRHLRALGSSSSAVVFNLGYAYRRGYAKTCYGYVKFKKYIYIKQTQSSH